MDKYFHLMFRQVLPFIDGTGKITNDHMKGVKKVYLEKMLAKLTKEHPVGWQLSVETSAGGLRVFDVTAENGEVEFMYVGTNTNGTS
jgi:hypothetical protein